MQQDKIFRVQRNIDRAANGRRRHVIPVEGIKRNRLPLYLGPQTNNGPQELDIVHKRLQCHSGGLLFAQHQTFRTNGKADHVVPAVGQHTACQLQLGCAPRHQTLLCVLHHGIKGVECAYKIGNKTRGGAVVNLVWRTHLFSAALVHDNDPVRNRQRLFLVMCHEYCGNAKLALDVADFAAQADADFRIQCRQRLVQQQHTGPHCKCTRQRHPLLLPAGQFKRIAVAEIRQADQPEHLGHPLVDDTSRKSRHLETKGHILRHGQIRKQRIGLEHQTNIALAGTKPRDLLSLNADMPRRRRFKTRHHAQHRRLAAAGRAQQRHKLTLADIKIKVFDNTGFAERLLQSLKFEIGHQVGAFACLEKRVRSWINAIQAHVMAKAMTARAAGS